jgi:hypothetical protein
MKKRKYIRGNTVSEDIMQINCKVVEGEGDIPTMLGIKPKEEPKQEAPKEEVKPEEKKEEPKPEKEETKPEQKKDGE